MTRYHINPGTKVLRCSAQSADSCPFGSNAHFEGDRDQARFMQDALDRNLKKTPPQPKAAPKAESFAFSSMSDELSARAQEDGTYTIYLNYNGEAVLIEEGVAPIENRLSFVRHLGDVARTSGYAGTVVDTAWMKEDPQVTQVREVRENTNGTGDPIGYLIKKGGGWATVRKLSELRSRPAASPGTGVLRAAANLRREVAQQQASKQALSDARDRGLAAAAKITEKIKVEPAIQAPRISPYPPLRSATTQPPFPYGRGSEV